MLSKTSFKQLLCFWSPHYPGGSVHPPRNAHLPMFGCPFRHPQATVHDALSADWNGWGNNIPVTSTSSRSRVPTKASHIHWPWYFRCARLTTAPWWPELHTMCSPLDLLLLVEQLVCGVKLEAQEDITKFQRLPFLKTAFEAIYPSQVGPSLTRRTGLLLGPNMRIVGKSSNNGLYFNHQ